MVVALSHPYHNNWGNLPPHLVQCIFKFSYMNEKYRRISAVLYETFYLQIKQAYVSFTQSIFLQRHSCRCMLIALKHELTSWTFFCTKKQAIHWSLVLTVVKRRSSYVRRCAHRQHRGAPDHKVTYINYKVIISLKVQVKCTFTQHALCVLVGFKEK